MQSSFELVVCIASTALFDCSKSHRIWKCDGLDAYKKYQREHADQPLKPGVGFPLVQSLLQLNKVVDKPIVDIVLISRNDAVSGLRIINSIEFYKLSIERMSFTCGEEVTKYLSCWNCDLFLTTEEEQVRNVLAGGHPHSLQGIAAGLVCNIISESIPVQPVTVATSVLPNVSSWPKDQVRIVFDGDGVLFLEEPQSTDLKQPNQQSETISLAKGPMQTFALKLQNVRRALGENNEWRIRTFLVTSSSGANTIRLINTLKEWGVDLDETHILSGLNKTPFLRVIDPAIFFDNSNEHSEAFLQFIPAVHIPSSRQTSRASIDDVVLTRSRHNTKSSTFNEDDFDESKSC
ncbi:unnamed protein product [Adineta ricciae]|uniref:5'-nucleotidase n=1 Tax=Adineta ricciae TaxID=249248 RepID=A0A815RV52_ADIRI|nr:unnamed protein product [Adineta ricciae]